MSAAGRSWMDDARARVRGWLGERDESAAQNAVAADELLSTEEADRREGGRSTWRYADDDPMEVEPHDDERPGLATYGPEDQSARVARDSERPDRARRAADGQGLQIGPADDPDGRTDQPDEA